MEPKETRPYIPYEMYFKFDQSNQLQVSDSQPEPDSEEFELVAVVSGSFT